MLRTADQPPRSSQKAGLLRVLKALAAVARYCGRNAGGLFLLVWFPCLIVAASQIVLDWLTLSFPPKLPAWLLSQSFNPPTWLTAVAQTPWGAMASERLPVRPGISPSDVQPITCSADRAAASSS